MAKSFFITGTDTDAGKTFIATALLAAANQAGLTTAAVKPVAAGGEKTADGFHNEDAVALRAEASMELDYQQVNPVVFEPAIAPHIAAREVGKRMTADRLAGYCRGVLMARADLTVIEGAGGWRVPINERETFADMVRELQMPVILVVGMKLGCINHALLTAEAVRRDGLPLAGWVANQLQPEMNRYRENLETLKQMLPCPMIAEMPYLPEAQATDAAKYISIDALLNSPERET